MLSGCCARGTGSSNADAHFVDGHSGSRDRIKFSLEVFEVKSKVQDVRIRGCRGSLSFGVS